MLAFSTDKKNPPKKSGSRIETRNKKPSTKARCKLMAKPFLLLKRAITSGTTNPKQQEQQTNCKENSNEELNFRDHPFTQEQ